MVGRNSGLGIPTELTWFLTIRFSCLGWVSIWARSHFPGQWVPHFGTTAQNFWLSSLCEPRVRPPGSWVNSQLQILQFALGGRRGSIRA